MGTSPPRGAPGSARPCPPRSRNPAAAPRPGAGAPPPRSRGRHRLRAAANQAAGQGNGGARPAAGALPRRGWGERQGTPVGGAGGDGRQARPARLPPEGGFSAPAPRPDRFLDAGGRAERAEDKHSPPAPPAATSASPSSAKPLPLPPFRKGPQAPTRAHAPGRRYPQGSAGETNCARSGGGLKGWEPVYFYAVSPPPLPNLASCR